MGAFAEMFPGRKPELNARDEESAGQGPPFRFPDGPLDLASGVIRVERRPDVHPPAPADPATPAERTGPAGRG